MVLTSNRAVSFDPCGCTLSWSSEVRRRTVGVAVDWCFDILNGGHLRSHCEDVSQPQHQIPSAVLQRTALTWANDMYKHSYIAITLSPSQTLHYRILLEFDISVAEITLMVFTAVYYKFDWFFSCCDSASVYKRLAYLERFSRRDGPTQCSYQYTEQFGSI